MHPELKTFLQDLSDEAGFDFIEIGIHTRSRVGDTPLHIAIIRGDFNICKLLIDSGEDVNATGEDGYTPLHEAITHQHPHIAELLLKNGADPNISTMQGQGTSAEELASFIEDSTMRPQMENLLRQYSSSST